MQKTLAEEIEAVRAELRQVNSRDSDLLAILGRVVHDVTTLTDEEARDRRVALGGQLEQQALRFEVEHPQLAGALRRVIKALADLGV
jgi:hypothetical protein